MKRLHSLAFLGLCLFAASPLRAEISPAVIDASASWVAYADLNAMRTSTVGKTLIEITRSEHLGATQELKTSQGEKLIQAIGSLTAYGMEVSRDEKEMNGVLIAQGTPEMVPLAQEILREAMSSQPGRFTELKEFSFPTYQISGPDVGVQPVFIAFPPEPIVLITKLKPQITKARDVFRGEADSLAKKPASPLTGLIREATKAYFFAGTTVTGAGNAPANAPQSRIMQLTNWASLAMGEDGANTFARAALWASSEREAIKLVKIVEGLVAMLSLGETNDKQLEEFTNAVTVTRNNSAVTMDLSYPSARLEQMLRTVQNTEPPKPAAPGAPR